MDEILHAWIFVIGFGTIFMAVIFWEYMYLKKRKENAYNVKESLANITSGFLYKMTDGALVALFIGALYEKVRAVGLQFEISSGSIRWLVAFIIADLAFYLLHMFMHRVRWGWTAHMIHHSSLRFNFSTALRQNFLIDLTGAAFLWWIPLALLGFDATTALIVIELNLVYQFFIHTETIDRMPRWYEAIFNTPSHHRVHHGSNPAQIDRNYAGTFIVWDKLFGTFIAEENAGEIVYGVAERQPTTYNVFSLIFAEFISMWKDVFQYKDLRFLWKPPGWSPNKN